MENAPATTVVSEMSASQAQSTSTPKQKSLESASFLSVDSLNEKLTSGTGKEREYPEFEYPNLYIAHYRGFHYRRDYFSPSDLQVYRMTNQTHQTTYAPAVLEASRVKFCSPTVKTEDVQLGLAQVERSLKQLSIAQPYDAHWQPKSKRRTFSSQERARLMRLCNSYPGYKKDVEKGKFGSITVTSSPYVATSDAPYHALRYAFGLKSSSFVLRPQYTIGPALGQHLTPTNFHIGKVIVIIHSLPEYVASGAHHIPTLGSLGEIDPTARSAWESETAFKTQIPGKYIVFEEEVSIPALGVYNTDIHGFLYGLTETVFDNRKTAIQGFRTNGVAISLDEAETELMERIARHQSARLLQRAKEYVEEMKGELVYQTLPDPKQQILRRYGNIRVDIAESKSKNKESRQVTPSLKQIDKDVPIQLKNLGNTCYMNASLQAVLAIPAFVEIIMAYQSTDASPTILNMIVGLHKAGEIADELNLEDIKTKCEEKTNERSKGLSQNDAHTFVGVLLDFLHDVTNRIPKTAASAPKGAEAWQQHLKLKDSLVYDIFAGQEKSTLTCGCNEGSETWTTPLGIILTLPNSKVVELSQLVRDYSRIGTTIKCEVCQNEATKVVTRWPKVLFISLSRFASDGVSKNGVAVKVDDVILVDEVNYQLCSAVVHIGHHIASGIDGGHYVSYVKKKLSDGDEKWFYCSDDVIREIEFSDVQVKLEEAYLLFYIAI